MGPAAASPPGSQNGAGPEAKPARREWKVLYVQERSERDKEVFPHPPAFLEHALPFPLVSSSLGSLSHASMSDKPCKGAGTRGTKVLISQHAGILGL